MACVAVGVHFIPAVGEQNIRAQAEEIHNAQNPRVAFDKLGFG